VLITGETGVGKELVAKSIHQHSKRSGQPLVQINCAALPENIVESELFGHLRGAFSGATSDRSGRFELADGGSLFLDEVGELPLPVQAKLLRALQSGEIQRVGSQQLTHYDWPGNVRELEHLLSRPALKAIREQGRSSDIISITPSQAQAPNPKPQ